MSKSQRKQRQAKVGAFVLKLIGRLPISFNRRLGRVVGELTWRFSERTVSISVANLRRCFPEKSNPEIQALAQKSIIETARTAMETTSIWRQPYSRIEPYILHIENEELIKAALSAGKGLIILGPHLGNWEALGAYLANNYQTTNMYAPTDMQEIDELMVYGRTRHGGELAPATARGVSMVLKKLRDNQVVGILPDQVPDDANSGKIVPFFNQPAPTMSLIHRLITKTKCNVILGFAKRVPGGFDLIFRNVEPELFSDDDVTSLTALNKSVENLVMEAPEQYQWEYKRFKNL